MTGLNTGSVLTDSKQVCGFVVKRLNIGFVLTGLNICFALKRLNTVFVLTESTQVSR